MNAREHLPDDRDLTAELDRLIDGVLSEDDRRMLLLNLDASPGGWRRCALAFLEAQAWREAFAETASPLVLPTRRPAARLGPWLAVAAGLLAAFGVGWMTRPIGASTAMIAAVPPVVRPTNPPSAIASEIAPTRRSPSNYAVGRLEREGYQVERTRVMVPARTRDGRPVAVPVQRTTIRYVGNRSA